jgi:hypothetical protein
MDNNPISQTLFRFVSLRNPELTNETGKDKRFVLPKGLNGSSVFYGAVAAKPATQSKLDAMKVLAKTFTGFTTEAQVKAINPNLYDFAIWLTRNKSTLTDLELVTKANALTVLSTQQLLQLWDNLFYQVVTQKTFYVKEAIMQLLLANHVISNISVLKTAAAATSNATLTDATIVLPQELFVEEPIANNQQGNAANTAVAAPANAFMQKQLAIATAKTNIARYQSLKKELVSAEKAYKKDYAAALKVYKDQYDREVQEIIDRHERDVLSGGIEVAKRTIASDIVHELPNSPNIAQPKLPEFQFDFDAQLDNTRLQNKLTINALKSYANLTGGKLTVEKGTPILDTDGAAVDITSFQELRALADASITENNDIIIKNTDYGTEVISVGGVLIPGNNSPYKTAWQYQLCPKPVDGLVNFDMSFDVPDSSWEVASMIYHLRYANGGTNTNGYYNAQRFGNTILLANLYNQGVTPVPANQLTSLEGEIRFTNGQKKTFSIPGINFEQCFTGTLNGLVVGNGGEETGESTFIPKGFGFKQIGIADYKKVDQTVHCYVEGEVAHIENIMAREYKEKSTRRLRRSENTSTTSKETERERQTDTSTTDRSEMQSEVSKVLQESRDFSANVSFSAGFKAFNASMQVGAGANYATHSSKDESTRQAVTQAKEVTTKALDRVVSKIKEERVVKMIEEFEENNKHGFDNREGDKHVTGVYRWVDKIYKNKIFNYGKRLMFEFMVPQPAKLHVLGMKEDAMVSTLLKPQDPRTATSFQLTDYTQLNETTAKYWAGKLNAEFKAKPDNEITIGKSFTGAKADANELFNEAVDLYLPPGYKSVHASIKAYARYDNDTRQLHSFSVAVGKMMCSYSEYRSDINFERSTETDWTLRVGEYYEKIPVSFHSENYHAFNIAVSVKAALTQNALQEWQQETFKAIMDAYELELADYNDKLSEELAKADKIKGDNPNFYRQIEQTILRKNCISYLVDANPNSAKTYGKLMHNNSNSFADYSVTVDGNLDSYTAFAKFLEQAFEWEIMSYHLYPFYWGNKAEWLKLYQQDNADGLFRSFMQSGLARVIVTVRPGFEATVQHYMSTGQIWNGGQVPVIGDPLYLSLVDEMKEPTGKPEGKAWATRVPTTLTILQADSIGLKVEKALPCNCDDVADFEDPTKVPCSSNLEISTATMESKKETAGDFN